MKVPSADCRLRGSLVVACGVLIALGLPLPLKADPIITEFLAANTSGLVDEDGDRPDWVEIHNPDPTPFSLNGSYLTDDPNDLAKWRFPDITLEPDDYLVIFASRKNRAIAGDELHANFALSRPGDFLALVNSDGTTIVSEFAPVFPEQFADISYGTTTVGTISEGFFEIPTPGEPNGRAKHSAVLVEFSQPSQTYSRIFRLVLSTTMPEATIRYTTDGSLPTSASPEYTRLIPITRTIQVRARAFAPGALDGPVRTETYFKLASDLKDFTSDLPLVVIDSLGTGAPPESGATNFKMMAMAVFEPKEDGRSSLLNPPDLVSRVGVRKRGSSTAGWPKYSMRLETRDEFDEDLEVRPFGMPPEADWVLSGRYNFDRALIRNAFMYGLSNQIGRYAARTQFVEVIHDTDSDDVLAFSDYFGVYTFMEQLKRDPNRIDIAELNAGDRGEPQVTGGYILKIDRSDPGGGSFSAGGQALQYNEPDASEITARQKAYLSGYIGEMADSLTRSDPRTGYQAYIDSGAWIDEHILRILSKDPDGLRLSTYLFKDRGGKLAFGPIWDFDRTIGCDSDGRAFDPNSWAPADFYFTQTWWSRLLGNSARDGGGGSNPDFWQEYTERWHELRQGALSLESMHALVDELAAQIAESQERNFTRWGAVRPNGGQFARGQTGWRGEVEHMKGWLQARVRFIDTLFLPAPTFSQPGGSVVEGFEFSINAERGSLLYTIDGSDPRLPGGARAPGSLRTGPGHTIVVNETVEVTARAFNGTIWSAPTGAVFVVGGDLADASNLAVSEILYRPPILSQAELAAGFTDRDEFEFLELINIGPRSIDLRDVSFVDGVKFDFRGGAITSLNPGGRVLVVSNRAAFEMRYGTDLSGLIAGEFADDTKLSNDGEQVTLVGAGGEVIRDFTFNDVPPWPEAADGGGFSLVLVAPLTNPDHGDPGSWRASTTVDGNPGSSDHAPFMGDPDADQDLDGLSAFLEHALGSDDTDPASGPQRYGATVQRLELEGVAPDDYLLLNYRRNLAADDVIYLVEVSPDLVTWNSGTGIVEYLSEVHQGDGTSIVTYRSSTPIGGAEGEVAQYMRLRVAGR
jgi:hypothetical protein